jgi:hypothetical protein
MMKMNGMKLWAYYLSHYVTFYALYAVSSLIFLITGKFSGLEFFTLTDSSVLILLFFVWGHVQIALAFLFSAIFSKSRTALGNIFIFIIIFNFFYLTYSSCLFNCLVWSYYFCRDR